MTEKNIQTFSFNNAHFRRKHLELKKLYIFTFLLVIAY